VSSSPILFAYLVAAVLFIFGMKRLSSPKTAPTGNLWSAIGMLIAILATLTDKGVISYWVILAGAIVGSVIGAIAAMRVKMTAMPQMVAVFNGFGGGASALVAMAELMRAQQHGTPPDPGQSLPIVLGVFIGALTFTGSMVAFAKLQELMSGSPTTFPLQRLVNGLIAASVIGFAGMGMAKSGNLDFYWALLAASSVLGVMFVIPIGGADMPVVVALLNSFSGLAAAATGFVVMNQALIISGALVGASGIILSNIMCRAMNRSLVNVLFGAFGGTAAAGGGGAGVEGVAKSAQAADVAMILDAARAVVIVPGYGMAVAQAQHAVHQVSKQLQERGIDVRFAIHPVAGRMPGHMNVLLAEAEVPYEQLIESERINPQLPNTDVALVVGANDVVNPAARTDPSSPLYGMPIVDVDKCTTVIVIKRSLRPGFSGVQNPLYYLDNTLMYFGDAKVALEDLTRELKELI